jgi:hypothetical protein
VGLGQGRGRYISSEMHALMPFCSHTMFGHATYTLLWVVSICGSRLFWTAFLLTAEEPSAGNQASG